MSGEELVPGVIADHVEQGRKASNLAFALRVLPPPRRRDALVFYRFCRILDDIADSPELAPEQKEAALDAWRRALENPASLPGDLADVVGRHRIPPALLREILAGVRADLTVPRYATFDEARRYCWRVASAVGLASIRIFGCARAESESYAESLGLALQWTNILRDVGEDAARNRIYLPAEDLARFRVSEESILLGRSSPEFLELMKFEAARAREFFSQAAAAFHPADARALKPAEVMRAFYSRLLGRMSRDGFRVFEKRYKLGRLEKVAIAARMLLPG